MATPVLAAFSAELHEGPRGPGQRQHRGERDLAPRLAVPGAAENAVGEERLALGGRSGVQLQRAGAEGALDVVHHPEGLEAHHPAAALGELGHDLADPVRVLEGLEGPKQHLHHPGPHLGDQRGLEATRPRGATTGRRDRVGVVGQRRQQLGDQRCVQVPHRQHHVHRRGAEHRQRPPEVRNRPEAEVGAGEGLGERAGRRRGRGPPRGGELRHGQRPPTVPGPLRPARARCRSFASAPSL